MIFFVLNVMNVRLSPIMTRTVRDESSINRVECLIVDIDTTQFECIQKHFKISGQAINTYGGCEAMYYKYSYSICTGIFVCMNTYPCFYICPGTGRG